MTTTLEHFTFDALFNFIQRNSSFVLIARGLKEYPAENILKTALITGHHLRVDDSADARLRKAVVSLLPVFTKERFPALERVTIAIHASHKYGFRGKEDGENRMAGLYALKEHLEHQEYYFRFSLVLTVRCIWFGLYRSTIIV